MLCGAKTVGNQLYGCVNEESNEDAGRNDFDVWTFLLVQVPGATGSEEISTKSGAVHNDDQQVEDLSTKNVL